MMMSLKRKPSFLSLINLCLLFNLVYAKFEYPEVHRDETVVDNLFGTEVVDPYRWLEDSKSADTADFVTAQNNVTFGYIRSNPNWDAVKESFSFLFNYTAYGNPAKYGDKYYMAISTGLQNQAIIYSFDSLQSEGKIFLNPNNFSDDGTTSLSFTSFSPDGKYCAYGISAGGSDWKTIKIRNVETNADLDEKLIKIKFASVGWNKNNKGFFYAYYDTYNGTGEGTETEIPTFQKLYYHNLNTPQSSDIKIFGFPDHPKWHVGTPVISENGKQVHIFPTEGTSSSSWLFANFDQENIVSMFDFKWITEKANAEYFYIGSTDNCTYIRTNYGAKNFRLICVDLNNYSSENWVDVVSEDKQSVLSDALIVNENYLVCVYMIDVVNVIQIHDLATGRHLFDVDTPIGTISSISGKPKQAEFFYKFSTFLSPGIIYRYDFSVNPNTVSVYKQSSVYGIDTKEYVARQIFYPSKDGTKVPMFLVHRKYIVRNGQNPTMLYAYGGFNINIQPDYSQLGIFFAKNLKGIYAVANIRGGGEFGEDWHKAGMLLNKQTVFDDFASAGEWLINNNYTSRNFLTINGRSNGGLLVGASSNQRPDIFGAALANVGVMDMVRFPLFTVGYAWTEEYGDPQNNAEQFNYIYKYSPLHNIKPTMTSYPNMLVLTADHDDRVVPAHSFKFISELQHRLGSKLSTTPLMIRIDANSGHGSGKPISKWIEEYTDIVCFLMNTLNYKYYP